MDFVTECGSVLLKIISQYKYFLNAIQHTATVDLAGM